MKKLLSITPHLSTGGAPQVLVKRVELIKDDVEIFVVEWNNASNDFIIQKNRLKKLLKPNHLFTLGDDKTEIFKIINDIQPDFIHFEEMPEFFVDFNISKQIYVPERKYKIFETTHSSDYNVDEKIFFPDKFLFVSQYNSFKFSKFGIPSEVIEYPVEKRERDPDKKLQLMKKLGLDPNFKHVLNVGLFTRRKNQGYAFEIARKLEHLPIKFHFIGNQADNFKYYWEPLFKNIPKNVVIWGERDDTFDFYDACDLFLFTSRGFRFDKELNPLVIKEALEHQIPQFIFSLDVYNRKYDIENDTIKYLFGDLDVDSGMVKNFLFPREMNPAPNRKYKIRAVHLLLEEDDRKSESIKELEKLKDYDIDYVQHINKRYTDKPPKDLCARPWDIGRLGSYSLKGPHYGNYTSFRKAILTEFDDDVDFLMIMESDCKLNVPIEEFVNKVFESCEHINRENIYYMSFGDKRNLRTGEVVSDVVKEMPDIDWMYETNKIIGIQCIMFPKFCREFVKSSYETCLWDVSDLYFNNVFTHKPKGIAPGLTTQIEGVSTIQGEEITHFLIKNENNFLNDKNENDIILEFNEDDKKFHYVLSDFYQKEIEKIKVVVKAKDNDNVFVNISNVSPHYSTWIQIRDWGKYEYFDFEFHYKDTLLFVKRIDMTGVKKEDEKIEQSKPEIKKAEYQEIEEIEDDENYIGKENEFELRFDENENKIWFTYTGKKTKMDVVVGDIDSNFPVFFLENTIFENHYFRWIQTGQNIPKKYPLFNGYSVIFKDSISKKVCFKKEIRLKNNKPLCNIDFYSDVLYQESESYYKTYHSKIYEDLNISKDDKWIIDLGSSTGAFIGYAYEKGAQNIIGIEADKTCFDVSQNTFKTHNNIKLINKAIYKKSNETLYFYREFEKFEDKEYKLTFNGTLIDHPKTNNKTKVGTLSLTDLMIMHKIDKIDVLKCDIEGYEWELFDNLSDDVIKKIDRIHLDFHQNFNSEMRKLFDRLLNLGFKCNSEDPSIIDSYMSTVIFQKIDLKPKVEIKDIDDEIFIVMTYPDTKIKEETTKRCINSLKNNGRKILLASHYPVPNDIQSMVDYYLFDGYNPLIEHTLYKYYWSDLGNVKINLNLDKLPNYNNLNQSLCVLNNLENSIRFVNKIGYKRVINVSYDFILNEDNIKTINNISERIEKENTQGYFMKFGEGDMTLLKSVFFIVNTDFYIQHFENLRTPEKYNKECQKIGAHNFLENYYMNKLKDHQHQLTIDETNEDELFKNENINIFSGVEYINLVPVKDKPNSFILWFNSSNKDDNRRIIFEFIKNGNKDVVTHTIKSKSYYYKKFELEGDDTFIIIANFLDFTGTKPVGYYKFNVDKNNIHTLSENGLFIEK